jgi:hypothetical protein
MHRGLWIAVGLLVTGSALWVGTAASTTSTTSLTGPGIVRITSVTSRFTVVDLGRRGASPGDMEITRVRLFNKRVRKRPLGNGQLVCTRTGSNFRNCNGTYVLPAGKLVVSGAVIFRDLYDLAVVGGTDKYNNVRGVLVVTRLRRTENLMVFRLVI